jgi:hypothetical protein
MLTGQGESNRDVLTILLDQTLELFVLVITSIDTLINQMDGLGLL